MLIGGQDELGRQSGRRRHSRTRVEHEAQLVHGDQGIRGQGAPVQRGEVPAAPADGPAAPASEHLEPCRDAGWLTRRREDLEVVGVALDGGALRPREEERRAVLGPPAPVVVTRLRQRHVARALWPEETGRRRRPVDHAEVQAVRRGGGGEGVPPLQLAPGTPLSADLPPRGALRLDEHGGAGEAPEVGRTPAPPERVSLRLVDLHLRHLLEAVTGELVEAQRVLRRRQRDGHAVAGGQAWVAVGDRCRQLNPTRRDSIGGEAPTPTGSVAAYLLGEDEVRPRMVEEQRSETPVGPVAHAAHA